MISAPIQAKPFSGCCRGRRQRFGRAGPPSNDALSMQNGYARGLGCSVSSRLSGRVAFLGRDECLRNLLGSDSSRLYPYWWTEIRVTSRTGSEYEDVTDLFRPLAAMNENSIAHRRQRDLIVPRCLPLADNIARRFANRGEAFDDLVQVARMGLMQAVNRFDPEYGSDFLAFAVPTIMGEVRRTSATKDGRSRCPDE